MVHRRYGAKETWAFHLGLGLAALASLQGGPTMTTCRFDLLGLADTAAYRRLARGILQQSSMVSGLNIPNKKPREPLLEWAALLGEEVPGKDLCVCYSLQHYKHHRTRDESVAAFEKFCNDAVSAGVSRVLLVTGPRGPRFDSMSFLEHMGGKHPAPGRLKLGVAFNACIPSETAREAERARLTRKLQTRLVDDVWMNCGSDAELLGQGAQFARAVAAQAGVHEVRVFGSVFLPNEAQLEQMRTKPWRELHLSEEYLSSLESMTRLTQEVIAVYKALGVELVIDSKVRTSQDLSRLQELLAVEAQGPPGFLGDHLEQRETIRRQPLRRQQLSHETRPARYGLCAARSRASSASRPAPSVFSHSASR